MTYRALVDAFAIGFGYVFMLLAAAAAAVFLIAYAINRQWEKIKDIYSWPWLMAAIAAHKKTHPRWQRTENEDD